MKRDFLLCIGINTGNSLDAADLVLTRFDSDGSMVDLYNYSAPLPAPLGACLRSFRAAVCEAQGDMGSAISLYDERAKSSDINAINSAQLIEAYTIYVADAVKSLLDVAYHERGGIELVDLIGFHGQTCAHQPPSIAKKNDEAYTVQIGDGQLLSNLTGIPVVFDFRSDDLINGGEAAPLAPIHHEHLARRLEEQGRFPVAFCNAGNTGNISVVSRRNDDIVVFGWDAGPFNDYPDKLMQMERQQPCDLGGTCGARGRVNMALLELLFNKSAVTHDGANFLMLPPPKSSDPQWYRLLPQLVGQADVSGEKLSFEDRLRTAEYFSAYTYFYSLKWIPGDVPMPTTYLLCGGGWNNPVAREHFIDLLQGNFKKAPVLDEHKELFRDISERLHASGGKVEAVASDEFGFSGQYMEARIFADAAVCRVTGEPFSRPETTACRTPTVLGIIRYPDQDRARASEVLKSWLLKYQSENITLDERQFFDGRWSRAARGWTKRIDLARAGHSTEHGRQSSRL